MHLDPLPIVVNQFEMINQDLPIISVQHKGANQVQGKHESQSEDVTDNLQGQIEDIVGGLQNLQLKDTCSELENPSVVSCHAASGTTSAEASDITTSNGGNVLTETSNAATFAGGAKGRILLSSESVNFSTPNQMKSLKLAKVHVQKKLSSNSKSTSSF